MTWTPTLVNTIALEQAHVPLDQIGDWVEATGTTRMLRWQNIGKDRVYSAMITKVWGGWWWEQWTTNLVNAVGEYPIPEVASDTSGAKKLEWVDICYNNETYDQTGKLKYIPAIRVERSALKKEWEWYEANQDAWSPLYILSDNSIFIAPLPSAWVTAWVKLRGIRKIVDYTTGTNEEEMKIPADYIYLLTQFLLPYIYRFQWKLNEANAETVEFERQLANAMETLGDRIEAPFTALYPDEVQVNPVDYLQQSYFNGY